MALGVRKLVAERLIAQSGESKRRYIDLCREWHLETATSGKPLATFGGRWDSIRERYETRHPETCTRGALHGAQEPAALWYLEWLESHLRVRRLVAEGWTQKAAIAEVYGEDRVMACLLYGGRGSGKSHLACEIAAVHALAVPGAKICVLCPEIKHTEEIVEAILQRILATEWRSFTSSDNTIRLVNGSKILCYTARGKRNMKIGTVDLAIINEAQEIPKTLIDDLMRLDTGGIQILTCNPPRSARAQWLSKWHEEMLEGVPDSVQFFLDPRRNPHVSPADHRAARRRMGEAAYRREYLGDMAAPLGDVVFDAYSESVNKLDFVPRSWRDVTREVAERWFAAPGADWIIGADFDKRGNAGSTWAACRFYCPPAARRGPRSLHDAVMVIEHCEVRIPGESVLPRRLAQFERVAGYKEFRPESTVIVADASSSWQNESRDPEEPPSWQYLKAAGWRVIKPCPDRESNPRRWQRFMTANLLLRRIPDERDPLVYVLPSAQAVRDALRYFPLKRNGEPDSRSQHAHPSDAWSYVAWRRWGLEQAIRETLSHETARMGPRFVPRPTRDL